MELSVLNSKFRRSRLVENWSSLIWTERYSPSGEFEMVSSDISETLEVLPLPKPGEPPLLVAIRESNVPMIVHTHKIEKPENEPPRIITMGSAFDTILNTRITVKKHDSSTPLEPWTVNAASPSDAAWYVMNQILKVGVASALDIIPEITLLDGVTAAWPDGTQPYAVEPKDLLEWVGDILKIGEHGLRAVLPPANSAVETIEIGIYDGADRRTNVVFEVAQDQFENATYLLSLAGVKNSMTTQTQNGITSANTGTAYSGLARKVGFQDLSSEITLAAGTDLTNLARNKGLVALADLQPMSIFSGEISALEGMRYNKDYFLGDKVTLKGEYGLSQDVRVAEFVRTHDQEGERSYPAFEALTP